MQKEETVETLKGPSLRVKKYSVGGMLSPGSIFKKGMTFTGELIKGMLGCGSGVYILQKGFFSNSSGIFWGAIC